MKLKFFLISVLLFSTLLVHADVATVVSRSCVSESVTDCAGEGWDRETCETTYSDGNTSTTIRYYTYATDCQLCMLWPVEGCF